MQVNEECGYKGEGVHVRRKCVGYSCTAGMGTLKINHVNFYLDG